MEKKTESGAQQRNSKNILQSNQIVTSITYIIIGVLFCAFQTQMMNILLTILGVLMIFAGFYNIMKKEHVEGIFQIVLGIIIIACGWTILDLSLLILGICLISYAIYILASNFRTYAKLPAKSVMRQVAMPILILIVGILLMVSKWAFSDAICIAIGVMFILGGLSVLIK